MPHTGRGPRHSANNTPHWGSLASLLLKLLGQMSEEAFIHLWLAKVELPFPDSICCLALDETQPPTRVTWKSVLGSLEAVPPSPSFMVFTASPAP